MSISSEQLVRDYIDESWVPSRARLREWGVSVWAIIGYLRIYEGDKARVAESYQVPLEAIEAAIAYYHLHRNVIDARILLNSE